MRRERRRKAVDEHEEYRWRDGAIRLRAEGMGFLDGREGLPVDWLPFTFLPDRKKDPRTLELVREGYGKGYANGLEPSAFAVELERLMRSRGVEDLEEFYGLIEDTDEGGWTFEEFKRIAVGDDLDGFYPDFLRALYAALEPSDEEGRNLSMAWMDDVVRRPPRQAERWT